MKKQIAQRLRVQRDLKQVYIIRWYADACTCPFRGFRFRFRKDQSWLQIDGRMQPVGCNTSFLFYKHNAYKHIQAQFRKNTKHMLSIFRASDFAKLPDLTKISSLFKKISAARAYSKLLITFRFAFSFPIPLKISSNKNSLLKNQKNLI